MDKKQATSSEAVLAPLDGLLPNLEMLYTDIHAHPELSMQETRTAGLAADRLRAAGYGPRVSWALAQGLSPPPPIACRSACSGAGRMARCRRRASTPW